MATRNTIGIFNEVWAGAGDRSEIPDFTDGFGFEYQVDTAPDRRHMNDVLAKCTALGVDVNTYGILPWNELITYGLGAYVTSVDGDLYRALRANLDKVPESNPLDWRLSTGLQEAWTLTAPTGGDLRSFNPNTATMGQLMDVVATMIKDLT